MKKFMLRFVSMLCAAVLMMSMPAFADSLYSYVSVFDGNGYNVVNLDAYRGNATVITMPYYIDDMMVVGVLDGDVYDSVQTTLKSFVWSPYVSGMRGMFDGFTALEDIVIPEGVTSLGSNCFRNCVSLNEINLPSTIKTISSKAFQNCTGLTDIDITHIEKIEGSAFDGCTNLRNITFGNSLKSIGSYAFQGTAITEMKLPYGIESVYQAFSGSNITHLELPDSVTSVGGLLELKTQLQHIRWPAGLAAGGFKGFTVLTSVELPEGVETISNSAFYGCTSLPEIDLPSTLKEIESGAFSGCTSLEEIDLPAALTSLGPSAFYGCSSLGKVTFNCDLTAISRYSFYGTALTEVQLPASLTTIDGYAFYNTGLTKVYLPSGVTSIGSKAFPENCILVCAAGSVTEATLKETTFTYATPQTVFALPVNVTTVEAEAFANTDAEFVIVSDECETIGSKAFSGVRSLKYIRLPESVEQIADDAFAGCNIVEATAPAGSYAEKYCKDHNIPVRNP